MHHRTAELVLAWVGASCLESGLVRQALCAAQGERRDLVVGVTGAREDFGAHAWLEGEPVDCRFTELLRRPAPE